MCSVQSKLFVREMQKKKKKTCNKYLSDNFRFCNDLAKFSATKIENCIKNHSIRKNIVNITLILLKKKKE